MRHEFITAAAVMLGLLAWGWLNDANAASRSHRLRRANWLLLAALRIPAPQLHLRNKRVSETLALPTLAT